MQQLRTTAARHEERWQHTAVGDVWSRLLEVEFVDRSIALAAKAFVSFFPFLIVVTALTPDSVRDEVLIDVSGRFGISGSGYGTLQQAFTSADETRAATGVIGALVAVAFAISFTTALQRVYLRAWRRPAGGGARNRGRGAVWMGGIVALMLVLTLARDVLRIPTEPAALWAIGLVTATGVWWWTAHLMLRGDVRWRALIPTALVTGIGSWLYTLAASAWMPATVTKQFAQFGAFGIALALVTWSPGSPGWRCWSPSPRCSEGRWRKGTAPWAAGCEPDGRRHWRPAPPRHCQVPTGPCECPTRSGEAPAGPACRWHTIRTRDDAECLASRPATAGTEGSIKWCRIRARWRRRKVNPCAPRLPWMTPCSRRRND